MARFKYYNLNPYGFKENDCVTRAISLATDTDYKTVARLLQKSAEDLNCCRLCVACYRHLLSSYFDIIPITDEYRTIGEVVDANRNSKLLLRANGHLTCAIDGTVFDIWDCRDEICTHYWII